MYLILFTVAYSVYLPPMGRRRSVKKYCLRAQLHTSWVTLQSRLLYAASAWHGFTKASKRQRINSLLDRAKRYGYREPNLPTFEELC